MYVICFENKRTNYKNYELTSLEPKEWEKQNPTLSLIYAFNAQDELVCASKNEEIDFMISCLKYGFKPTDYKREIVSTSGERMMLIGFRPENKKYKCRLKKIKSGKFVKATPEYVRQCMGISLLSGKGRI